MKKKLKLPTKYLPEIRIRYADGRKQDLDPWEATTEEITAATSGKMIRVYALLELLYESAQDEFSGEDDEKIASIVLNFPMEVR